MAFQKTVTLPGGYSASYWTIDRICWIDEKAREAKFFFSLYADSSHIDQPARREAVHVTFRGAAFDAYFSKAAVVASGVNAYAGIYQAVTDATAAFKAKAGNATLTDAQRVLTSMGNVDIASDFGGSLVFDGATEA